MLSYFKQINIKLFTVKELNTLIMELIQFIDLPVIGQVLLEEVMIYMLTIIILWVQMVIVILDIPTIAQLVDMEMLNVKSI